MNPRYSDSPRSAGRASWFASPIIFALFLASIFFAIVAVARFNALTFPLPNEDDASFFFPAWNLALHGTLRVAVLNAPDGIFWVPHGFYLWLALFFRIFGPTAEVAHTVCQLTTAVAAVVLVVAYSRLCGSRGFALLCGALLLSPGVFFAANMIRMESLILLLFATGLLLHSYERRLAAAAIFFLGVVVHPALLLGATLYAVGIFWADVALPLYSRSARSERAVRPRRLVPANARILTIVIVSAVACAIALEGVYVLRHLPTFHQHMAYQIARKANRSPLKMLLTRRGLFLIFELVFTATIMGYLRRRPHALAHILFANSFPSSCWRWVSPPTPHWDAKSPTTYIATPSFRLRSFALTPYSCVFPPPGSRRADVISLRTACAASGAAHQ